MRAGLEDVVAAQTVMSRVDGLRGELVLRGRALGECHGMRFEEMAAHLWRDFAPAPTPRAIGQARARAFAALADVGSLAADLPATDGLRLQLAALPEGDPTADAVMVSAALSVAIAGRERVRRGGDPLAPDPQLGQAADTLRMMTGEHPTPEQIDALDTYWVTVSDHGLNASTFVARIVASTGAGIISAVVAALSALKGPLHGGAPGPVLDMLDTIATPEAAPAWIAAELEAGRRLMGFGHRVYRVRDPRADVLAAAAQRLGTPRTELARAVERAGTAALAAHKPDRPLHPNVEFYTAVVLEALGFDREAFTSLFAAGRVLGWCAHAFEQREVGRLIRPKAQYIGP